MISVLIRFLRTVYPSLLAFPNLHVCRPPGTLLLTMIIKNEAEHLRRTLPKWAKIIDYWLIGVDDANTDESPEVIKQILGHIPGEIVIVRDNDNMENSPHPSKSMNLLSDDTLFCEHKLRTGSL
jgi:hypothetical protein